MIPSEVTDLQLVSEIKATNNNEYILEAISRWSGSYVDVCKNYTYVPKFEMDEILLNKNANIYKYVIAYQPDKGMKINTFIAQMAKYECKSRINLYQEPEQVKDNMIVDDFHSSPETKEIILQALDKIGNERLAEIVKLRFFGTDTMPWKEIGKKMGLSHEWCRMIFDEGLPKLKLFIEKELKNQ